jgi:two-component system, NarL family, nitrate/nitrite response regulator NarL
VDTTAGDHHTRIAVMSDRRLFRDALVACLAAQDGLSVVGHAGTAGDLRELCALRSPDAVVLAVGADINATLSAAGVVRSHHPETRIVVVYEHLTPGELAALWRTGVDTLVPASHGLDALVVLIRRTVAGPGTAPTPAAGAEALTDREREILLLVGAGHTVYRVAELLETSMHAVENAKRRIYRKLDVASHSQAVGRAAALGIIDRVPVRAPITVRATGVPLAVLRGPDGPVRQRAVVALLAQSMPFAIERTPPGARHGGGEGWHRGPVLLVLIEPSPEDWPAPETVRSPVVLVRSGDPESVDVVETLNRGIAAVVQSERVSEDLVPALTLAARGYLALEGVHARALLAALNSRRADAENGLPELTARESDILRSIAAGHTVRQTARSLGIAEKTVENTQARLFRKLGARNRAGALATAHAWGLIEVVEPDPPERPRRSAGWAYAGRMAAGPHPAGRTPA